LAFVLLTFKVVVAFSQISDNGELTLIAGGADIVAGTNTLVPSQSPT
jgi:hypothetical protein